MFRQTSRGLARISNGIKALPGRACREVDNLRVRRSYRRQGVPIPRGRLIELVAGTSDVAWFLESGALACRSLRAVLGKNGLEIESFRNVLDFGCGVGRVMRHWGTLSGPALHGSDYNPRLVAWCRANLPFARSQVNGLDRRLEAAAGSFDLVYALSVFTHLAPALERFWVDELTRVLAPGGYLFLTTHGSYYLGQLSPDEQAAFRAGRVVVRKGKREGSNDCAVFHPESYVRSALARGLEVVDFVAEGAAGNPRQDIYLLRKPVAPAGRRP